MRIFALTAALMLAHPVTAFEPETNGVFSQRVISIVEQVTAPETVLDQPGGARGLESGCGASLRVLVRAFY